MANADIYAVYDETDNTKEPGTFTGTKFHDIMPNDVDVPGARLTARLCNFPTNISTLRGSHRNWIRDFVQPVMRSLTEPWIDLTGYASQLRRDGHQNLNFALSNDRCRKVKEEIANYSDRIHWNVQWPKGAAASSVNLQGTQNDGWWRAVVVSVFGYKPAHVTPATMGGYKDFEIRLVFGGNVNVNPTELPLSPLPDASGYLFEIVALKDNKKVEKAYFWHAAGAFTAGVSLMGVLSPVTASPTRGTGPTPFHTSVPVELHDFEGPARVFSDGQISSVVGGTLRISIESDQLARLRAVIRGGSILAIKNTNDPTVLSLGTAGFTGPFKIVGTTSPIP